VVIGRHGETPDTDGNAARAQGADRLGGWLRNRQRAELEALLTVGSSSFAALTKAYQRLPWRNDDHLRVGMVLAQVAEPGTVRQARAELAQLNFR
jgi:hypothetical protein